MHTQIFYIYNVYTHTLVYRYYTNIINSNLINREKIINRYSKLNYTIKQKIKIKSGIINK